MWVSWGEDGVEFLFELFVEVDFILFIFVMVSVLLYWCGEWWVGVNGYSFAYVSGVADDEESWSRGFMVDMFYEYCDVLFYVFECDIDNIIVCIVDG